MAKTAAPTRGNSEARRRERNTVKVERRVKYRQPYDYILIVALTVLVALGLIMVYSSSYYMAEVKEEPQAYYFLKQMICVALGAILMVFFMFFDYHNFMELPYQKYKWMEPFKKIKPYWAILILGFISLGLVFVPGIGVNINGSRRWINIGISIQPSEIMKMGIIIFMACSIGRAPNRMRYFTTGMLPYLVLLGAACAIIYMQPNFSAIICIAALVMCLIYIGGAKYKHLGVIAGAAVIVLLVLVSKAGYRAGRLSAWKDPWSDPIAGWQLSQSLLSIGSGGLFGRGLGNSMQKMLYLPYRESDFIFAIIAEELGLVGCIFLIGLFAVIIWRGIVIAMRAPDLTGTLIASGSVAMIAIQVVVNIGVNIGLLPSTGVVLPFVSYGGSSVLIFMSMIGLTLNIGRQGAPAVPVKRVGGISALELEIKDTQPKRDEKPVNRKRRRKQEPQEKRYLVVHGKTKDNKPIERRVSADQVRRRQQSGGSGQGRSRTNTRQRTTNEKK